VCQGNLSTRCCVRWGAISAAIGGISGVDVRGCGEGGSTIGRVPSGVFEAHRGTPVPPVPYSPSFITTEGKRPRGRRDGVSGWP